MINKLIYASITAFLCYVVYHPARHAKRYSYVKDSDVFKELLKENLTYPRSNLQTCSYEEDIIVNEDINVDEIYKRHVYKTPLPGGEFLPQLCKPLFKTAILVPYRNRKEHLELFLNYMHMFLQLQNIHYRIFIIEQNNSQPFNRAKLLNFGATEAMKLGFHCLILHDVDIMPLSTGNIYACSRMPRHMCSSLDTFRFNLPYEGLFGGVVSISAGQFKAINGMSNVYDGWGGEDDDLFTRLEASHFLPYRFSPKISRYTMLFHKKEQPSEARYERLRSSIQRQKVDGLNNMSKHYVISLEPLYTHLITP